MVPTHLIIPHIEDPDGIISTALILRNLYGQGIEDEKIQILFTDYKNQKATFETAANQELQNLETYVADLAAKDFIVTKDEETGLSLAQKIKNQSGNFTWYDHHGDTKKNKPILEESNVQVHYQDNTCTARIIFNQLEKTNPADTYADLISKISQSHDYAGSIQDNSLTKLGIDLQGIITLLNFEQNEQHLLEITKRIAKGRDTWLSNTSIDLVGDVLDLSNEYKQQAKNAMREMEQSIEQITLQNGYTITTALASDILPPKDAPRHFRENFSDNGDGYLLFFSGKRQAAFFFKNYNSQFSPQEFCTLMGGGGREGDGAFNLPFEINNQKNYKHAKNIIFGRLNKFLEK
jgi:hypothetical protein